jgi:hypothetical protein
LRVQLLEDLRKDKEGSSAALHAALLAKDETDHVSALLDQLDPSNIPASLEMGDLYGGNMGAALSAFWGLVRIFECLSIDSRNPAVVQVRLKFGALLVERWSHVVQWLAYLLLLFIRNPGQSELPPFCTGVLTVLLEGEERDAWQEEILYRPQTTDLVHVLLCQTEPQEGSYHYMPETEGCAALWLLWKGSNGMPDCLNALIQLNTVRPRTRERVIKSLVLRASVRD